MKIIHLLLFVIMTSLTVLLIRCSDPASANKETLVRTLPTVPLNPGEYSYFWDGKDDSDQYVEPGRYYCELYEATVGDTIQMTVLEGGEASLPYFPNPERIGSPSASTIILYYNQPDPFHVKEGTKIYFTLPEYTSIRLTIHRME